MLERLEGLPIGIVGVRATGTVTREDYARVFEPIVARGRQEGLRLRCLFRLSPKFERFAAGAG